MEICSFWDNIYELYRLKKVESIDCAFEDAKKIGVESVDIPSSVFHEISPENVCRLLRRHGLKAASVHSAFRINYKDGESIKAALEKSKKMVDAARAAESPYLMLVPMPEADMENYCKDDFKYAIINLLRDITGFASQAGVTITIENFSLPEYPYSTTEEILYILNAVPGVKYTYDTGNFVFVNDEMLRALDILYDYTVHVHLKDWIFSPENPLVKRHGAGFEGTAIGSGFLPVAEAVAKLKSMNYNKAVTIEIASNLPVYERYRQSADFIRGILNA